MSGGVEVTIDDEGVAVVVLDHPPVNALTEQVRSGLVRALAGLAADEDIRVVVLTGAGERAFCAGQDLGELSGSGGRLTGALLDEFEAMLHAVYSLPVPAIAAVNGPAVGGGLDLALSCDLVFADATASFRTPGLAMGIVASVPRLMDRLAPGALAEFVLLGATCDAARAQAIGLVDRVIPAEGLRAEAMASARQMAGVPRPALVAAKRLMRQATGAARTELVEAQLRASSDLLSRELP